MSLPTDIANSSRRLRELAGEMRGHLNELRVFVAVSERAAQVLTNAKALLACVQAECTALETTLAGEGKRQQAPGIEQASGAAVVVDSSARYWPHFEGRRQQARGRRKATDRMVREAMIESLHRAGDHSLDDDAEAAQRRWEDQGAAHELSAMSRRHDTERNVAISEEGENGA